MRTLLIILIVIAVILIILAAVHRYIQLLESAVGTGQTQTSPNKMCEGRAQSGNVHVVLTYGKLM